MPVVAPVLLPVVPTALPELARGEPVLVLDPVAAAPPADPAPEEPAP